MEVFSSGEVGSDGAVSQQHVEHILDSCVFGSVGELETEGAGLAVGAFQAGHFFAQVVKVSHFLERADDRL